ncbi:MAG: hypothetical protein M3Q23_09900 [Actinomycetota bacterium]|nr:hypothetical protein [Actinomycetota bacterium]
MGFKKERLGPRLVRAARSGDRYRDAHMFLGGTGAVGGTAVLQMLSLYEEMFSIHPPEPDDVPVVVATGTTPDEIQAFTRRLFRFVESRHGPERLPRRVRRGYLAASGVFIALERFQVSAISGLRAVVQTPAEGRPAVVASFLDSLGASVDDPPETVFKALATVVSGARPFTEFLERYRDEHLRPLGIERFRSVVVGIPIPSLVAYHQDELKHTAEHVQGFTAEHVDELKELFVEALRDDLVQVQEGLADTVLMAHTTGVGGMYDDDVDHPGRSIIRLGFAHAGLDLRLAEKQRFAEKLTRTYSAAGIKVLVTAAAIGIDEVRVRERIPLHRGIRQLLFDAPEEVFPGSKGSQPGEARASRRAGRPLPSRHVLRVFRPLTVPLDDPPAGEATFELGEEITPSYAIRSGENGFFTVANAEALYRVMRVASASELGLMLATVSLFGDDRLSPWFRDDVCYFDETDNARQVLDFLAQPALRRTQLSGLEPMSLQDLGSAKHQGELHTLSLLILLHRLRTLDVDAIDPYVDLEHFDARAFFVERSRALTFEDVAAWGFEELARDLQVLVSADQPEDLLALTPSREQELFPRRQEALRRVLDRVLHAVWQIPSLGSPLVFEREGRAFVRTGYYVAPLDLLIGSQEALDAWFRHSHEARETPDSFQDFRDYHMTVGGFVDVRPHAVVCTAKSEREDLTGKLGRFRDEEALRAHLLTIEPYASFATSGLLAVWFRLRSLFRLLREAMIELGSLHEFRWHMPRDARGHILVVPGVVESFRMVAEGLEKTTGTERLDGIWGYERRPVPDRRGVIPGISPQSE